jgi:hypothetical protein
MFRLTKYLLFLAAISVFSCQKTVTQPTHEDVPFTQDHSIKFYSSDTSKNALLAIAADRNGKIQVLHKEGLLHTKNGQFLFPGSLVTDRTYRFMSDKKINDIISVEEQFVYLTDQAVVSNAWAGELYIEHSIPQACIIAGYAKEGESQIVPERLHFLVSDGSQLEYLAPQGSTWKGRIDNDSIHAIRVLNNQVFFILSSQGISTFNPESKELRLLTKGESFTHFDFINEGKNLVVGTKNGYLILDSSTGTTTQPLNQKLPVNHITSVTNINNTLWFGSTNGAFSQRTDGKFNYYAGERWIPNNHVINIIKGAANEVLILTSAGVGKIVFEELTLHAKALFFEKQVRDRHIRNGFNSTLSGLIKGDITSGYLDDSDNDGLWTSMYLGGQAFRYAVTKEAEALQNCRESLDAMERLYTVNPVPGFPARSYERSGHIDILSDPERWQHSAHKDWDWKATTSSDEAIGHMFVFGVMAELIDEPAIKAKAIMLMDTLMSHILTNDMYLVDYDGKPTLWGKWNPSYVNGFPTSVGDRKLNSSNIISMLQTAYYFTKKEKYKEKAYELMEKHGYLENLMRPMKEIGQAPEGADDYSKMLSEGWNHSDDEMYFLGYWGLYRYAFDEELKSQYKVAILDHFEAERPEKDGLWNIMTALTGVNDFDLKEAIWYLQEYPLDLIDWNVRNSHRKDITLIEPNFRHQTTTEVLPPDETPIQRHNSNTFRLEKNYGNGSRENSAGDIWLLPYWMGRYLNVISDPKTK